MTAEMVEREDDDFLAFWRAEEAKHGAPETVRILGVDVVVPTDMPVMVQRLVEELSESSRIDDIKRLLAELFGQDLFDRWMEHRLTNRQLRTLLKWGMRNADGTPTTFAEALELVRAAEEEDEGKAPTPLNRAERRASSRTRTSGTTGRSSSRTSGANTRSRRIS